MYKMIVILILIIFFIIIKNIIIKGINKHIDCIFEKEFNKRTNRFVRLFISKEKKRKLNDKNTLSYKIKISKIINTITLIIIIILTSVLLLSYVK